MGLTISLAHGGADFHSYLPQLALLGHRVLLLERFSSYSGTAVLPILSIPKSLRPLSSGRSELVLLALSVAEGSGVDRPAPILSRRFRPCRKGSGPENAKQISQPSPFFSIIAASSHFLNTAV